MRPVDQLKFKVPQSGQVFIFWWEMGDILDQLKFKVPQSGQVFIFWWEMGDILDQVKPQVTTSLTIFISGGGEGHSGHHIPEILAWGHPENFEPQILTA